MPRVRLHLGPADDLPGGASLELLIEQFPFVVGRHPQCDGQLVLPFISRYHCSLFVQGDEVCVQDLNSRNGTYVNDRRALLPQVLHDGDHLRLGSLIFHVSLESAEAATVPGREAGAGRHAHAGAC